MPCRSVSPDLASPVLWPPAPEQVYAAADMVHLWLFHLGQTAPCSGTLEQALSADEIARADRFRFSHLRQHYVAGRGIMRRILGRYLGLAPEAVAFHYREQGKPELVDPPIPLKFNLSHSGELGLLAVALGRQVGADIEFMRPMADLHSIAAAYFSPREIEDLQSLPPRLQVQGFFNCWTRKEAYLKGIGKGFAQALNAFDVTLKPDEAAALIAMREDPDEKDRWRLRDVPIGPEYAAAVIAEGQDWDLQGWRWEG